MLTKNDRDVLNEFKLFLPGGDLVNFQFPPKIITDNKTSNWKTAEGENASYDEVKTFLGSGPRALSLKTEFIVGFDGWTGLGEGEKSIGGNLSTLKSYFYDFVIVQGDSSDENKLYPVVTMLGYMFTTASGGGGAKNPTFRIMDLNINYSEIIVKEDVGTFPLHTELTMQLEFATQIGQIGTGKDPLLEFASANVPTYPRKEWY